jgi:hypothetical protein
MAHKYLSAARLVIGEEFYYFGVEESIRMVKPGPFQVALYEHYILMVDIE